MIIHYSNYVQPRERNEVFTNDYIKAGFTPNPTVEALFSLTGLVQKYLQHCHNDPLQDRENGCRGGAFRKFSIGAGFLGTVLLGAIETPVRFALMIIGLIIGGIAALFGKNDIATYFAGIGLGGFVYTALYMGQAAVSLYSHSAYTDDLIDYEGQANKYLFHMKPVDEDSSSRYSNYDTDDLNL